jgi:hypothetical protein
MALSTTSVVEARKQPRKSAFPDIVRDDGWWNAPMPGQPFLSLAGSALGKKTENYLAFLHPACAQLLFARVCG